MGSKIFKKLFFIVSACLLLAAMTYAQPRPAEKVPIDPVNVPTAPAKVAAKYEGGMFGYSKKEKGTILFDDINERLVFLGKDNKEVFGIAYRSLIVVMPSSKKVTSTTGQVISHIPLPGAGLAGLIKSKKSYLVLRFNDADANTVGTTSFKLESSQLLASVIKTLGEKAEMKERGDAYYRPANQSGI